MATDWSAVIATLELQRASGVAEVEMEGRRVRYRTDAEIAAALAFARSQLGEQAGTPVTRLIRVATGKGLC